MLLLQAGVHGHVRLWVGLLHVDWLALRGQYVTAKDMNNYEVVRKGGRIRAGHAPACDLAAKLIEAALDRVL